MRQSLSSALVLPDYWLSSSYWRMRIACNGYCWWVFLETHTYTSCPSLQHVNYSWSAPIDSAQSLVMSSLVTLVMPISENERDIGNAVSYIHRKNTAIYYQFPDTKIQNPVSRYSRFPIPYYHSSLHRFPAFAVTLLSVIFYNGNT